MRRFGSSPKPSRRGCASTISRKSAPSAAQAVAHAVVPREVRRRLRRRDRGSSRRARSRPSAAASTRRPRRRATRPARSPAATASRTPGSMPSASFSSLRHADAHALEVLAARQLDVRARRRSSSRSSSRPADDPVEERAVAHVLRRRPDLVEARRERDDAVAADGAVGRPQADDPAERRRLLDRAAGVGAERPRREPAETAAALPPPEPPGTRVEIPRIVRRPVRGVLGRRAHRELVGVRLAEQCAGRRALQRAVDGRVVDRDVALEDLRAGRRRHALRRDHVLRARSARPPPSGSSCTCEVGVQLAVALVDRLEVRVEELAAADLLALEQAYRAPRRSSLSVSMRSCGRHPKMVVVAVGGVRKDLVERQRRPRLVLRPGVRDLERVRGRRHVREVELRDLRNGLEDRRELLLEASDLVVARARGARAARRAGLRLS